MSEPSVNDDKKKLSLVYLIAGILIFLFGLSTDWLGIGIKPGIGLVQALLMIVGLGLAVFGFIQMKK